MRRKNASDDDDDFVNNEGEARIRIERSDRKVCVGYGDDSDGLGGYDDGEEVSYVDELADEGVEVFEEEEENVYEKKECEERCYEQEVSNEVTVKQSKEKKEWQPPVDPKNGAFYMHDDRSVGRRHSQRRWKFDERSRKFKDDEKWKHDKFDEMKVQETYDKKFNAPVMRTSEQYYQGHHKNQRKAGGYVNASSSKTHDNMKNQNSSRIVRGRGPMNYKPTTRQPNKPLGETSNTELAKTFSRKKSGNFVEVASNTDSVRVSSQISNQESDSVLASEELVMAANTSSASQMFNSSSPSNHCTGATPKRDTQRGRTSGYFPTSARPNHKILAPESNSLLHTKIAANPIRQDLFYREKLIHPAPESYLTNLPLQSPVSWLTYPIETPQVMVPRDLSFSTMFTQQLSPISKQVGGVYPQAQHPVLQQIPVYSPLQPPLQFLPLELSPCSGNGSQASSEALLANSYEQETPGSLPGASKSKVEFGGKGTSSLEDFRRGSLLCAETQGDPNFTATAALIPTMRPGGQHSGDPAVNTVVSSCISPSHNGLGNPEITWLPVFPASAGTVGVTHSSPNVTAHSTDSRLLVVSLG
ncbi:protein MLN51 homolog [Pistacia vera]|uniref:protein MLN51 homolog n=1 Tax=Pistacia vera TaxID=55513 RepID=UPI001263DE83|nr:protein MLN51 homolog [Pistacia vera]